MLKTTKEPTSRAKSRKYKAPRRSKVALKANPKTIVFHGKTKYRIKKVRARLAEEAIARGATSRLEARISTAVYEVIERAAMLRGLTVTAYVTATMGEDARRTIEQTEIIRLSRQDQIAFAKALINPPEPTERLRRAASRHAEMMGN
jgi:uncharacterized protein (DUF1778 family)